MGFALKTRGAAQRSGSNFQKAIDFSARLSTHVAIIPLPPTGGRYVSATRFIGQRLPFDYLGCVTATGRGVFFDAKACGEDCNGLSVHNPRIVEPHQIAALVKMRAGGAIAGLLVECRMHKEYRWLDAWHLRQPRLMHWMALEWLSLGDTAHAIDFRRLVDFYGAAP